MSGWLPSRECAGVGLGVWLVVGLLWISGNFAQADESAWRSLSSDVLTPERKALAAVMIEQDVIRRTAEANARNRAAWNAIDSRAAWEAYRNVRLTRLRRALGEPADSPARLNVHITGRLPGEGFTIRNVLYESRPGLWVTGNLYLPQPLVANPPGLLIAHSHHRDKPQSELQDMGMTWARAGCVVLVIDQFGSGERRLHPFARAEDYAQPFPVSRQDYRFRYDSGVQLHLLGESLMGWMVWDLMRGVDLLLQEAGADPQRIGLLGAVAGGGDPAGVTAALDPRIAVCVPFNFGGPQPETRYPLPEDAETSFNYLGGAYWESTRGLRLGGRDDFPHWVIVGSLAPRKLIHAHEFAWDHARDPVWKRYQKIWGEFYEADDRLAAAHGHGSVRQAASEASHCTNIGAEHRRMIHPHFARWLGIQVTPDQEYSAPRKSVDLQCWTDAAKRELQPIPVLQQLTALAEQRASAAQQSLAVIPPADRRKKLQARWEQILGPVTPQAAPVVLSTQVNRDSLPNAIVERITLEVEPGILVPLLLIEPTGEQVRQGCVLAVSQGGKAALLQLRSTEWQTCLNAGLTVVLPDVRGTGESSVGRSRGQEGAATNLSANLQLFGETLVGQRLRDLRSVLRYLSSRPGLAQGPLVLWGEAGVPVNPSTTNFQIPRGVSVWPAEAEPLGGLLAFLGALYEERVSAAIVVGGLTDFRSALSDPAVFIPHDAAIPGAISAGDLDGLAAGLMPLPLMVCAPVNHRNQPVSREDWERRWSVAISRLPADQTSGLQFATDPTGLTDWIAKHVAPKQ